MNNIEIICNEAILSGYYSKEEIENLLSMGLTPDFHSYSYWKSIGMVPRRGQKGWECRLWRKKNNKIEERDEKEMSDEERKKSFYLTKTFLFHISQCDCIDGE